MSSPGYTVPSPRQAESVQSSWTKSLSISSSRPTRVETAGSNFSAASNPASPTTWTTSPPPAAITVERHVRRPSLPMSPSLLSTSPRAVPVPVPNRGYPAPPHRLSFSGSPDNNTLLSRRSTTHAKSGSGSSLSSASADLGRSKSERRRSDYASATHGRGMGSMQEEGKGEEEVIRRIKEEDSERKWLDLQADQVLQGKEGEVKVVKGSMGTEEAVEILLKSGTECLLVDSGRGQYGFFDFADLNTFLLLVLCASAPGQPSSRTHSRSNSQAPSAGRPTWSRNSSYTDSAVLEEDEEVEQGFNGVDERGRDIIARLKKGEKVVVGDICDISQKNPYHAFPASTPLRTFLPLFSSGLHRIALTLPGSSSPRILSDKSLLEHLSSLPSETQPCVLGLPVSSPTLNLKMHSLISLPGSASVLDAMQVMSLRGLSALGVLSGSGTSRDRRESSGSSGSSSGSLRRDTSGTGLAGLTASPLMLPASPANEVSSPLEGVGAGTGNGELVAVVTAAACTKLVVPSEGKQVLGMGIEDMAKGMQYLEEPGQNRGEERVPVHTIPASSTLLHASHLILATSSSRVFLRSTNSTASSFFPQLSPAPSLSASLSSPPSSPSLSSLSLSDRLPGISTSPLPPPPPTMLSPHYVVSTIDILAALAKAYSAYLTPPERDIRVRGSICEDPQAFTGSTRGTADAGWEIDPQELSKRRRASSSVGSDGGGESGQGGFGTWRWAGRVGR